MSGAVRTDGRCSSTVDPVDLYRARVGPGRDAATRERALRVALVGFELFPDVTRRDRDPARGLVDRWLAADGPGREALLPEVLRAVRASGQGPSGRLLGALVHAEPDRQAAGAIAAVAAEGRALLDYFLPAFARACDTAGFPEVTS